MNEIVIVDYGMGNLHSVKKAVAAVGAIPIISCDKEVIKNAEKLILPGVGAFGDCMQNLEKAGLVDILKDYLQSGKPFLGICLGMQVLFEGSEEAPGIAGLGYFKGQVVKITTPYKIPHMGWNKLKLKTPTYILKDAEDEYVYFVHSYHALPEDKDVITAICDYGSDVTASVGRGAVQAFQFHPEKSSHVGLGLLKAFKELTI